jgi:Protein of unknown function (DUF4244)
LIQQNQSSELSEVEMTKPIRARWALLMRRCEAGMTTAEYAVGTVAAVGFALVLYRVVRSPAISAALSSLIRSALNAHF